MRYLILIFSLIILNNAISQNIIKILENAISSGISTAHSEMKGLELELTYVQDREELLILLYNEKDLSNYINSGSIIVMKDFKTVIAFSMVCSTKDITQLVMNQLNANNYKYKQLKDGGEIIYSNGIYDLGLKTESSSIGVDYRVSIMRVTN